MYYYKTSPNHVQPRLFPAHRAASQTTDPKDQERMSRMPLDWRQPRDRGINTRYCRPAMQRRYGSSNSRAAVANAYSEQVSVSDAHPVEWPTVITLKGWLVASPKKSRYQWAGGRRDLDGVDDRDALVRSVPSSVLSAARAGRTKRRPVLPIFCLQGMARPRGRRAYWPHRFASH